MTTKQSKVKIDYSQQVWDTYPHKLLLYVMSAKDVAAKDSNGKSDPYVVIEHGKFKKQTKIIDKTLNPVWNECFFIQADPTRHVKIEMWDHDMIGSPDYMGHVTLDLKTFPPDRIVDLHPSLLPRKRKEDVSGSIHIRIYHSAARETRPPAQGHAHGSPDLASPQFLYRPFKNAFKPGDLIGYSGHGVISGLQKILTGNPITSVGMVVYLPNKWTGDVEPYVIEMTRNVNRNIDVFSDTNTKSGIYIFHLFERFHQFHGSDLVHFPLVYPLPSDMYKKVVEKVWEYHKKNTYLDEGHGSYRYGPYLPALNHFIREKKNWTFDRNEKIVEGASFDFVARILRDCGAHTTDHQDPADIIQHHQGLYSSPILIRQVPGEAPLHFMNYLVQAPTPPTHSVPQMSSLPSYSSLPVYTQSRPSLALSASPPTTHPRSPQPQRKSVALSKLEVDMLSGLLDGWTVADEQLVPVDKRLFRQRMLDKGITVFKDEAKFDAFYNSLDTDADGKVDIRELVCGLGVYVDMSVEERLRAAFKVFDRDGDHYIHKSELRRLLSTMLKASNKGVPQVASHNAVVETFVTQIFAEYDENHDGRLTLQEFLTAAHTNTAVGNLFLTVSSFV